MTETREGSVDFVDNAAENRYELFLDDRRIGLARYAIRGGKMIIPHTEIEPRHGGRGLGSEMVRRALDDARSRHLRVVPSCPFVADFIRRNPDYADLLAARPD